MVRGRGDSAAYNDPTSLVLVKNGWVAPTGTQYEENGYCWESHQITPAALLALEFYLQKVRHNSKVEALLQRSELNRSASEAS
jgi:hypothetical protein